MRLSHLFYARRSSRECVVTIARPFLGVNCAARGTPCGKVKRDPSKLHQVMDDRYAPPFCACGCHAPRPPKTIESPPPPPPHEPCCCCDYNPFSDNPRESEIYDLPFALRKLTVMKCQMKKWRMERLQLESENRSLKQALRSFGIGVPLHSRNLPPLPSPVFPPFLRYISCEINFVRNT